MRHPTTSAGSTEATRRCHAQIPARPGRPQRVMVSLVAGLLTMFMVTGIAEAGADCARGGVNCKNNTAGTKRTCTAQVRCSSYFPYIFSIFTYLPNNVTACAPDSLTAFVSRFDPLYLTVTAMAPTTAPEPRQCNWAWNTSTYIQSGSFSIRTADGLPVELMDFFIESEHETPADSQKKKPEISSKESR